MRKSAKPTTVTAGPDYLNPNLMNKAVKTMLDAGPGIAYSYERMADMFELDPEDVYKIRHIVVQMNAILEPKGRTLVVAAGRMGWVLGNAQAVALKANKYIRRGNNSLARGYRLAGYVKGHVELSPAMQRAMAALEKYAGKAITQAAKGLDISSVVFAQKRARR